MKGFLKVLDVVFSIILILWNLVEILAIPALFLVIGLYQSFPWQYYAITIGGYFALAIVIQLICHAVFARLEKKYESALTKLFSKWFNKSNNP